MCRYVTAEILQELCDESASILDTSTGPSQQQPTAQAPPTHPPFQAQISELLIVVLENEEDAEGQLSGLTILQELLSKYGVAFDEQFVRLGLPNKIAVLAGPGEEETAGRGGELAEAVGEGKKEEKEGGEGEGREKEREGTGEGKDATDGKLESSVDPQPAPDTREKESEGEGAEKAEKQEEGGGESEEKPAQQLEAEDATDIAIHTPYRWREWCAVRSRDCLYLWNGFCAIELSTISNGWFRFLIDNKLATMYSSGSTEGGAGSFGESSKFFLMVFFSYNIICIIL